MSLWDRIEKAGHDFTLVSGPIAGRYTYYCERCATLMILISGAEEPEVFHPPAAGIIRAVVTVDSCPFGRRPGKGLRDAIDLMDARHTEGLKRV